MTLVAETMNRRVVAVGLDASLADAREVVRRTGAEHVLVLDEDTLVGILCACDLRGARGDVAVSERMSVPVLTVRPDAPVEAAALTMRECGVGCLPVTLGGLILGTMSEAELERAGMTRERPHCEHGRRHTSH